MALPKKRQSTLRKGRRRKALLKNFMKKHNISKSVKKPGQNTDNVSE